MGASVRTPVTAGKAEAPGSRPGPGRRWCGRALSSLVVSAYHELGRFGLLDAGRGDLEEQLDGLPDTLLVSPVLLQLPRGHARVGARAADGLWEKEEPPG